MLRRLIRLLAPPVRPTASQVENPNTPPSPVATGKPRIPPRPGPLSPDYEVIAPYVRETLGHGPRRRIFTTHRAEQGQHGAHLHESGLPQVPHCDAAILHAPGECEFCDLHPDWQTYRKVAGINFTGHQDPDLAPCPSEHFRPAKIRDRWPGNRPTNERKNLPTSDQGVDPR